MSSACLGAHERVKIPASPRSTGSESPFSQEAWVPSYIGVWGKPGLSCFWLGFQYWQLESKLKPCLTNRWQRSHILLGNDMKTGQRQLCFHLRNSLGPIRSGALTLSPALCPNWEETPRTHIVNALFWLQGRTRRDPTLTKSASSVYAFWADISR